MFPSVSRSRVACAAIAAALILGIAVAGCSSTPDGAGGPSTDPTGPPGSLLVAPDGGEVVEPDLAAAFAVPPGFVPPDNRGVPLTPVTGKPKPDEIDHSKPLLPIQGGTSKIVGTVFGPDGPIEGATVRLERVVGIDFGRLDVVTDEDGRYEGKDLLGGRYRVRAWVTESSLATVSPQLTFLPAKDGERVVDITIERRDGLLLQGAIDRAEPHVGERIELITLLAQEFVDDEGIVQGRGIPAAVLAVHPGPGLKIEGERYGVTDADGYVRFAAACTGLVAPTVGLESSGLATTVTLPECKPAIDEPTTTTTTAPTAATSTTARTGRTTTTTRPR